MVQALAMAGAIPTLAFFSINSAYATEGIEVSGAVGVATENVARGISYSSERPAAFGNATIRSGDLELAGSLITVSGGSATYEAALALRYVFDIEGVQVRAQIERTAYPGAHPNIDYWEYGLTARRDWEDAFVQLGLRHSPDDSGGAQYVFFDVGHRLARTSLGTLSIKGRYGWRPYDDNTAAGQPDYQHWSVGLELTHGPTLLDLSYHDTDLPPGTFFPSDARVTARLSYRFSGAFH